MTEQAKEKKPSRAKGVLLLAAKSLLAVLTVFLLVYMISVITSSGRFFKDSAERSGELAVAEDAKSAEELTRVHYNNLYELATKLEYAASKEAVDLVMGSYIGSASFGDLRYFCGGKTFAPNGVEVDSGVGETELLLSLASGRTESCTEIYRDSAVEKYCIAFFVPVRGSAYVDGVLSVVPAREILDLSLIMGDEVSAAALVDRGGRVYSSSVREGFTASVGNNLGDFIGKLTHDEEERVAADEALRLFGVRSIIIDVMGENYILSMSPVGGLGENAVLVTLTVASELIAEDMKYIYSMISLVAVALVIIVIGIGYMIFYFGKSKHELSLASYTDTATGCPNADGFKQLADRYIRGGKEDYAVGMLEIRQYAYILEKLGDSGVNELISHIAKVLTTFTSQKEAFGYSGEGRFLILIRNTQDKALRDKIKLIEALTGKHPVFESLNSRRHFNVGIAKLTDARRYSISELISFAKIAAENAKNNVNVPYVLYTEEVNRERARNERIEAEMEAALEAGDFRMFLQPKYNVAKDRIDSAEALVRWFDPLTGDYRFPGEFIGLFESNGFITKLDHFMYIEALKFLSSQAERGEKVVPISVNVSLVTASAKDFLDFYIDNKRRYRVEDGFIMVEFTESFAMGDYQKIYDIVQRLHRAGIKCSLDDFGSGYASFGALKNIPVDELKLDRMFLERSLDARGDEVIIEMLISMAKTLGVCVVQEGVEDKATFDRLVSLGCDIIQGYYYAKAISKEEFKLFISSNTSIKYKSQVK